ncbi:MAG: hypothetical protein WCX65_14550 [bacterium]
MKKLSWRSIAAICLLSLSAFFYMIDYIFTGSWRHIMSSLLDNVAFVFIYIFLAALVIETLLQKNEKKNKMEKLNMVIGVFFNEAGSKLLLYFSKLDKSLDSMRGELHVTGKWNDMSFAEAGKKILNYKYELQISPADLEEISGFLIGERDFLLRLLENPILLEHETFTELLMAVFHLADEFANRQDFNSLPESDRKHLEGDIRRAYDLAIREWLVYMKYLKTSYPYLFSLAIRTNPFDKNAKVIISQ